MIFNDWNEVIGKTIKRVKEYTCETKGEYFIWTLILFDDGILLQEFNEVYYESGSCFCINEINKEMPKELKDIITQYA